MYFLLRIVDVFKNHLHFELLFHSFFKLVKTSFLNNQGYCREFLLIYRKFYLNISPPSKHEYLYPKYLLAVPAKIPQHNPSVTLCVPDIHSILP